jgi:hypothetical protein
MLTDYRNSMQKAWYYVKKDTLAKQPIIVLDVTDDLVYIDAGSIRQIKVGDRFNVCRETKILHPVSGEEMGSHKLEIALIEITEVQEKMSVGRVVEVYDEEMMIEKMDVVVSV